MLVRTVLLAMLLVPGSLRAQTQSPATPDNAAPRPPILGSLEQGKYSNPVLGLELHLDPSCVFFNEEQAVAFSTKMPQRLGLPIQCGSELFVITSFPLEPDEKLRHVADVTLSGTMAAGGFAKRGHWQSSSVGGTEVLVQKLTRGADAEEESAFYYAFIIGRRYVSILADGPKANKAELGQTLSKLRIEPKPAR